MYDKQKQQQNGKCKGEGKEGEIQEGDEEERNKKVKERRKREEIIDTHTQKKIRASKCTINKNNNKRGGCKGEEKVRERRDIPRKLINTRSKQRRK